MDEKATSSFIPENVLAFNVIIHQVSHPFFGI